MSDADSRTFFSTTLSVSAILRLENPSEYINAQLNEDEGE